MRSRIELHDNAASMAVKMSDGNPGALSVVCKVLKESEPLDPDSMMGPFGPLLSLDTLGIYGSDIWILWKDVCDQELVKFVTILRANQLGIIYEQELKAAMAGRAKVDHDDLFGKVKAKLPAFCPEQESRNV